MAVLFVELTCVWAPHDAVMVGMWEVLIEILPGNCVISVFCTKWSDPFIHVLAFVQVPN